MKYGNGTTPVSGNNSFTESTRREIVDGLKERLANEQIRIDERKEKFYKTLLPLCDTTSEANNQARRIAYRQNAETKNLFVEYQQHQQQLKDLQYRKQQKMNEAMEQYSATGMRAQRDKAGEKAGSDFNEQIALTRGFMTNSMEEYSIQQMKSDLANQQSVATRFENIHAYNNAISEGFSLASDQMDLADLQRQIGFFEGMA